MAALAAGHRIRLPTGEWVTVDLANPGADGSWTLYVLSAAGHLRKLELTSEEAAGVTILQEDGSAPSARVLAGMWTQWMAAAAANTRTTLLASSPLRPYAHQTNAVYGAMLPQPYLRFLLADEPGTGKTIMAGMYMRELQRLGIIKRALIVVPANLVSKWQADFDRFFGGGLRRITADTVREHGLETSQDLWVVSLELAAVNPAVQEAIRPDRAGWDLVVVDEAHRLTPTATAFHQVGRLLTKRTPRALLMTATPHRGSEWLFRHLLHLVDPAIYPDPGAHGDRFLQAVRPGRIHFLRRMKEDLVDYDGVTRLFKGRVAKNHAVPLSGREYGIYSQALEMVSKFFPVSAQPLASMVYGKRAASSLFALEQTLSRRSRHMGEKTEAEAALDAEFEDFDDEASDEARVIHQGSVSSRAEQAAIQELLAQIKSILADHSYQPSKWKRLTDECLRPHGIIPGGAEQAVVFTEYADSAEWMASRLQRDGFSVQTYSGRLPHRERDRVRAAFMKGDYQVIVTTDAGNEGIDLQAAHVLVNYDIPWSLVRLEQRMGRIHRVGQNRDVFLHNLVAVDTREGATLQVLLDRFVTAANELGGQMFDSLSAVAEMTGIDFEAWLKAQYGDDEAKRHAATEAARKVTAIDLQRVAAEARAQEALLATQVDALGALTLLQDDLLERINPAVVERYLTRLDDAHLIGVQSTAAGSGVLLITADQVLPAGLGEQRSVLVATSGEALRTLANSIDTSDVLPLGPGDAAFRSLVDFAEESLSPDMYRSGAVDDPTSITGYELFAYEAVLTEGDGRRSSSWAALIRVDPTGQAYSVRWESLANLIPADQPGRPLHPATRSAADAEAAALKSRTEADHRRVRTEWFAQARRDLATLPLDLTVDVEERDERISLRRRLSEATAMRLAELERLSDVRISEPRLVGRVQVLPAATPPTLEEKNSEEVAMRHVQRLLESIGWRVADVHRENRGYDLHAVLGREQRLLEVKGVWTSAANNGVRMTGGEVLMATQHRREYWLYVVEQCSDGQGVLYGAYRDPAATFQAEMTATAIFGIPGTSLSRARASDGES